MTPVVWAGGRSERALDHRSQTFELHEDARRFEYGPWSWPLVHAWAAGLDYLDSIGIERIAARAAALTERLITGLDAVEGVTVHTPRVAHERAALVAFAVDGWSGRELERYLRETHAIVVRSLINRLDGVRASTAFFTSEAEVDALIDAIRTLPAHISTRRRE